MKITLPNEQLPKAHALLESMELRAGDSRARTRLVKLLEVALQRCIEDEQDLVKEFVQHDGQNFVKDDDGNFKLREGRKASDYLAEQRKFLGEYAEIEGGTYAGHREKMVKILEAWDKPIFGDEAETYDILLTALEEGED